MDDLKTNEEELTSTMGNLMSTGKEDKNDASDSTPTSSTDAFTTSSTSRIVTDDPISSTSSDISEKQKSTDVNDVAQSSTNVISLKDMTIGDHPSPIVSENDLLDMNITDTSTEKITENVDDIVQDLENLLGEPTTSFDFNVKHRETRSADQHNKDISADLDRFSVELQMLQEQSEQPFRINEPPKDTSTNLKQTNKNIPVATNQTKSDLSTTDSSLTKTLNNADVLESPELKPTEEIESSETSTHQEKIEGSQSISNNLTEQESLPEVIESSNKSAEDAKTDISTNLETLENCQSEIISDSNIVSSEAENAQHESEDITSTLTKSEPMEESSELKSSEAECVSAAETQPEEAEKPEENPNLENMTDGSRTETVQEISEAAAVEDQENLQQPSSAEKESEDTAMETSTEVVEDVQQSTSKPETTTTEDTEPPGPTMEEIEAPAPVAEEIEPPEPTTEDIEAPAPVTEEIEFPKPTTEEIDVPKPTTEEIEAPALDTEEIEPPEPTSEDIEAPAPAIEEREGSKPTTEEMEVSAPTTEEIKVPAQVTEEGEPPKPTIEEIEPSKPTAEEVEPSEPMTEEIELPALVDEAAPAAVEDETKDVEAAEMTKIESPSLPIEAVEESQPVAASVEESLQENVPMVTEEIQSHPTADTPNLVESSRVEDDVVPSVEESKDIVEGGAVLPCAEELSNAAAENEVQTQPLEAVDHLEVTPLVTMVDKPAEDIQPEEILTSEVGEGTSKEEEIIDAISEEKNEQVDDQTENVTSSVVEAPIDVEPKLEEANTTLAEEPFNVESLVEEPKPESLALEDLLEDQTQEPAEGEPAPAFVETSEVEPVEETHKTEEEAPVESFDIDSSSVLPTEFETSAIELPTHSLAEDLDLLVQNTVAAAVATIEQPEEKSPTLVDALDEVQENLSLAMDEVPDLEILNAISNLSDNKSTVPEISQDALLGSSEPEVPFEATSLPTVDEILTEPNQQEEIQDDNLETLLAVASLQNVDYNIAPVEDFAPPVVPPILEEPVVMPFVEAPLEMPIMEELPKPVEAVVENQLKEPLQINVDETEKERVYSPKITIKPIKPPEEEEDTSVETKGSLKMTITKQPDNTHSILKIYNPDDDGASQEEPSVPKLIIKPLPEQPQSPKVSTRSSKVFSPSSNSNQRSASPRITIKPIIKPDEAVAPLKITIKPVLKPDDGHKQKHSPKLTIKPIVKPDEENEPKMHSPRVTIKPIVKPVDEEQVSSPRITIKPIVKPVEETTPRVTIKPVVKPVEEEVEKASPKITIKPIVKPVEEAPTEEFEDSIKERIVLKINKGTIPGSSKREEEKSEKLAKIKLKFSKEGGHPQIVQTKRQIDQIDHDKSKRQRLDDHFLPGVTLTPIGPSTHSKLKEMLSRGLDNASDKVVTIDDDDDDVTIVEEQMKNSPIVISEESNQDSLNAGLELRDPMADIPVFEITPDSVKTLNPQPADGVAPLPAPRKRGRPRKVPLQVREDFKDPKEEEPKPVVVESTRPKRSCRGQSVRTTLGIKPRKPRGPGRGRGSKRGMGTRSTPTPPSTPPRATKLSK